MENKQVKGPKQVPSRFKITPLAPSPDGQNMMYIEDTHKKIPSMAISHKDAVKKFTIETVNTKVGSLTLPMPHPKYSDTDIELANQVNGYLVGVNTPEKPKAQAVTKPTEKKKYSYSKEYYAQKRRESRMRAASDAKRLAEKQGK